MSIAILKRKTFQGGNPRVSPISGNSHLGFALNGTLRIGPQVGVNLGSSFFDSKNNLEQSCGKKNVGCVNDKNYIKTSVKNTKGMLASRRINSKQCCNPPQWFQPINSSSNTQNSQGQYINYVSRRCFVFDASNQSINSICKGDDQINSTCNKKGNCIPISAPPMVGWQNRPQPSRNFNLVTIAKNPSVAISSGEYLRTKFLANKCIPVPRTKENAINGKLPFPPNVNNNQCSRLFTDQKIAANNGIF